MRSQGILRTYIIICRTLLIAGLAVAEMILLFYSVLFVPWESMKSRPQPGVLPAMDGSMYIESNHLSFISYNDCNYHQAVIWGAGDCDKQVGQLVLSRK